MPLRVLVVGDPAEGGSPGLRRVLANATACDCLWVPSIEQAWPLLEAEQADVLVSCLDLKHGGVDVLSAVRTRTPGIPVVIVSETADEPLAIEVVRLGAQDALRGRHLNAQILRRSLRFAIERQKTIAQLRDMSLVDHLTKLYNRRGLFAVVGKRLEMAQRLDCRAFVMFADLDHLKQVNDEYGHAAGDGYLQLAAEAIKQSFRAADVVARVGGDEFVILGLETTAFEPSLLITRVEKNLERLAKEYGIPHSVSMSCGVEQFDPAFESVQAAIEAADALMYRAKRSRREPAALAS